VEVVHFGRSGADGISYGLPNRRGTNTLLAIPAFIVVYIVAGFWWEAPIWLALIYVGVSLVTYLAYSSDKTAARRGRWRIAEGTLHALSLAGGWPGALIAQQFLRHKSAKTEFRAVFWCTVVMNVIGFLIACSTIDSAARL